MRRVTLLEEGREDSIYRRWEEEDLSRHASIALQTTAANISASRKPRLSLIPLPCACTGSLSYHWPVWAWHASVASLSLRPSMTCCPSLCAYNFTLRLPSRAYRSTWLPRMPFHSCVLTSGRRLRMTWPLYRRFYHLPPSRLPLPYLKHSVWTSPRLFLRCVRAWFAALQYTTCLHLYTGLYSPSMMAVVCCGRRSCCL